MRTIVLVLAGLLALTTAVYNKKVVCYFTNWAVYRQDKARFGINDVDPKLCTHLIYSFVGLNTDATIKDLEPGSAKSYQEFNKLRLDNPHLKTMVAMGGWNEGSVKYSNVMKDPSLRSKLVKNIVDFVVKHEFNGFDLDWEYPAERGGASVDKENFVLFLKELNEAFKSKDLILSIAVGVAPGKTGTSYNVAEISKYVDFINMMEYDLHGHWDQKTGHNSPLYSSDDLNVDKTIQLWIEKGAPAEKIIMGIPFYARGFTLSNPSNHAVGAPSSHASQPGTFTKQEGFLAYYEVCGSSDRWTCEFDEEQRVPYAYKGNQWISFDNEQSIEEKADYVKKNDLGGMMIWSIDMDDFNGVCGEKWPLLNTINKALSTQSGSFAYRKNGVSDYSRGNFLPRNPKQRSRRSVRNFRAAGSPQQKSAASLKQSNSCDIVGELTGDPHDCNVFYQCTADLQRQKLTCPTVLVFNPQSKVCDYKQNVQC